MKLIVFFILSLTLSPAICGGGKPHLSSYFLSYIKTCENETREGWDSKSGKWFPYWDGSAWHIAYGHLIEKGEFLNDITEAKAQNLLASDLEKAHQKARIYFEKRGHDIRKFSNRQVEIILDFTFNGCLYSHPKFMKAVATSDLEGQRKEYKRYAVLNGQRTELKDRNTRFFNRYLK